MIVFKERISGHVFLIKVVLMQFGTTINYFENQERPKLTHVIVFPPLPYLYDIADTNKGRFILK